MKLTILFVQHELTLKGSSLSLYYLIKELDRDRYEPIIVCSKGVNELRRRYEEAGVEVITACTASYIHVKGIESKSKALLRLIKFIFAFPVSFFRIRNIIRTRKISLVHLNTLAVPAAALSAKSMSVPVLWCIREVIAQGRFGIRKRLLEWTVNTCADEVIAISRDEASAVNLNKKVTVINNSVDFKIFNRDIPKENFRRENDITKEDVCIGMIGSIDPIKGVYDFVEAARLIKSEFKNIKFFVVGGQYADTRSRWINLFFKAFMMEKDNLKNIKKIISTYHMENDVYLTGNRDDMPSIIAAMDLIVCPYRLYAIGRPAIEAASMGKPVVAASNNYANGIVIDGVTGILFPPGNSGKLAESIAALLKDKEKADSLGANAYTHARQHFDSRINTRKIMDVYESMIKRRRIDNGQP